MSDEQGCPSGEHKAKHAEDVSDASRWDERPSEDEEGRCTWCGFPVKSVLASDQIVHGQPQVVLVDRYEDFGPTEEPHICPDMGDR